MAKTTDRIVYIFRCRVCENIEEVKCTRSEAIKLYVPCTMCTGFNPPMTDPDKAPKPHAKLVGPKDEVHPEWLLDLVKHYKAMRMYLGGLEQMGLLKLPGVNDGQRLDMLEIMAKKYEVIPAHVREAAEKRKK